MNFRLLWILMVGLFAYLLFWEWSQESAAKAELVATTRVDEVSSGVDSVDSSNTSKISNGSLTLVVDNLSGSIIGVELSEYPVLQKEGSPNVRLLGSEGAFKFYVKSGFGIESPAFSLKNNDGSSITLVSDDGLYKKVISIKEGYLVDINDSYLGGNKPGDPFVAMYRTDGKPLDATDSWIDNASYVGVAFNTPDDPYDSYRLRSIDERLLFDQVGGWVGFIQKYFLTALLVNPNDVVTMFANPPGVPGGVYSMGSIVREKTVSEINSGVSHKLFFGPKIRSDLMLIAKDLELSIDMGWFWFLAQPLVMLLVVINDLINNWGVSILLLTVVVKLLLWPISAAGFRSMAKMRVVQPKLQEIQQRYKDDRQKLGVEMMALYKKEKINPAGGCFPMLLQFPVFIALFFALREIVELRHAPFFFWLQDLSAPDPYFVLPVVMGGLMYLTQQLNPTPPNMDPMQVQVMKYMPVVFSVFFIFLPSGLVLYSVANALFSLVQQRMMYRKYGASSFSSPWWLGLRSVIFALATPVGKSAIAVIRVAGEGCHKKINSSLDKPINTFGQIFLRDLRSQEGVLDSCMLVFYKGPKSYCGEDMVEIFSHGGLGVVKGIVGFLEQLGMREAEPGEFTRLSVANNKMSLNEAEMVSTLIDSIDEHEVMLSVAAISGALSERVVRVGDLIDLLRVELESQIDFSDEDGVNEENIDRMGVMCNDIIKQLGDLRNNSRLVDDVGEKKSVLLVGPPNSGKSSLFNSMLGRTRSITSDIAGTTRDMIESEMVFNSNKFSLFDSAGIRDTNDEIESSGISLVLQEAKNQSLVLVVVDNTCLDFIAVSKKILKDVPHIIILNKSDLGDCDSHPDVDFTVSAKTGFGVSGLVKGVAELISSVNQDKERLFLINNRQAKLIDEATVCCVNCLEKISIEDFELAAEELKQSRARLDDFIGSKSSDDLLGDIFANFCIGK